MRRAARVFLLAIAFSVAGTSVGVAAPARGRRPAASAKKARAGTPAKSVPERSAADRADSGKAADKSTASAKAGAAAAPTGDSDSDAAAPTTTAGGKTLKTKTYTFGAMDVEGKLKTPQLLYFLDRVKLELDMSAPDKRSFIKELEKSADDSSL